MDQNSDALSNIQDIYLHTFNHIPCYRVLFCLRYFSYCDYDVHYSNPISLMSVKQWTHIFFVLLSKSKNTELSYPRQLITTPFLHQGAVKKQYPEVHP